MEHNVTLFCKSVVVVPFIVIISPGTGETVIASSHVLAEWRIGWKQCPVLEHENPTSHDPQIFPHSSLPHTLFSQVSVEHVLPFTICPKHSSNKKNLYIE